MSLLISARDGITYNDVPVLKILHKYWHTLKRTFIATISPISQTVHMINVPYSCGGIDYG